MSATASPDRGAASLPRAFALGAAISIAVNLALYFLGRAIGAFPDPMPLPNGQSLDAVPVVVASIVGMLGATVVFAGMRRFLARPAPIFRVLALVLLVASFVTPFGIPDASTAAIVLLELMHVVVAVAAIATLAPPAR